MKAACQRAPSFGRLADCQPARRASAHAAPVPRPSNRTPPHSHELDAKLFEEAFTLSQGALAALQRTLDGAVLLWATVQAVGSWRGTPFRWWRNSEMVRYATLRARLIPPRGRCSGSVCQGVNERFSANSICSGESNSCAGM